MTPVYFEAVIYAVQVVSFFLIAGPVMVRTERRQTLARNPTWIVSQQDSLKRFDVVSLRPFRLVTMTLLSLLFTGAAFSSRKWMFAVHTPLFLVACAGLYVYYDTMEKRLRVTIPEQPIRRALLRPRTFRAFLPSWMPWGLVGALAVILGVNIVGLSTAHIEPSRALANGALASLLAVGLGLLLRHTLERASYRMSAETDSTGRSMELSLTLATAAFFALVCLYHSLGSWGPVPLFAYPPTQLHALIESTPWIWDVFFERHEYRWVELGTAVFIALLGPWLSRSAFTRRLMAADPQKVQSAFEV